MEFRSFSSSNQVTSSINNVKLRCADIRLQFAYTRSPAEPVMRDLQVVYTHHHHLRIRKRGNPSERSISQNKVFGFFPCRANIRSPHPPGYHVIVPLESHSRRLFSSLQHQEACP
jgi:hypothetical protein